MKSVKNNDLVAGDEHITPPGDVDGQDPGWGSQDTNKSSMNYQHNMTLKCRTLNEL